MNLISFIEINNFWKKRKEKTTQKFHQRTLVYKRTHAFEYFKFEFLWIAAKKDRIDENALGTSPCQTKEYSIFYMKKLFGKLLPKICVLNKIFLTQSFVGSNWLSMFFIFFFWLFISFSEVKTQLNFNSIKIGFKFGFLLRRYLKNCIDKIKQILSE